MRYTIRFLLAMALAVGVTACDTLTTNAILDKIARPDESAVPDSVREQYQEDAAQLAVRFVQQRAPQSASVTPPADRVTMFYNALLHVYNADAVDGRDTITGIHTFPRYNLHEIIVAVDTAVGWTEAWQSGERLTGQPDVDALLKDYTLAVEFEAEQSYALVRSETAINPVALSRQFETIEGVTNAEQNGYFGDGNDIEASVGETSVLLTYSRGWGDCSAGCINREAWSYRVGADGSVRFIAHDEQ